MNPAGHPYRKGHRGRSLTSAPGIGCTTYTAWLTCGRCGLKGERRLRALMPPDQIDKKFTQAGWRVDPHVCPDCRRRAAEEKSMASKPSAAAIKAQARMFNLLHEHFDPDAGSYATGWSDQKIAAETSLAVDLVTEFRKEALGDLKEPAEIDQLRKDMGALEQLQIESNRTFEAEMRTLRNRLGDLVKRWAA